MCTEEEVGENLSVEVERERYSRGKFSKEVHFIRIDKYNFPGQLKQGQSTLIVRNGNQTTCDLTFVIFKN